MRRRKKSLVVGQRRLEDGVSRVKRDVFRFIWGHVNAHVLKPRSSYPTHSSCITIRPSRLWVEVDDSLHWYLYGRRFESTAILSTDLCQAKCRKEKYVI